MTGETIELEANGLCFRALAAGAGDPVLCLHGFPDHYESFRHQLPMLADHGYRAVAPMMRGYEPSSQPGRDVAAYHPMRLAHDVVQWARVLGEGRPQHLVGHDWGAVTGALACLLQPSLFRSYTSVAIANFQAVEDGIGNHPGQIRNSWYMFFFQLRGLADWVVARNDFAFIEKLWRDWSPGWAWEPEAMASLKQTFHQPGVRWSALAYYRAMRNPFLEDSKRVRDLTHVPLSRVQPESCRSRQLAAAPDAGLRPSCRGCGAAAVAAGSTAAAALRVEPAWRVTVPDTIRAWFRDRAGQPRASEPVPRGIRLRDVVRIAPRGQSLPRSDWSRSRAHTKTHSTLQGL